MNHTIESYVRNIAQVRFLSSPKLSDVKDASSYRELLRQNFVKIGELSKINREILDQLVYPVLLAGDNITSDKIEQMGEFADELLNDMELENLDPSILLMLIEKLLNNAIENKDDDAIIKWIDEEIMACYTMLNTLRRITIRPELADAFRVRGDKAAERIFDYLDKEKFAKLSDDSKERVLTNARYFCVMYEGVTDCTEEENTQILELLKRALRLCEDDFYREQVPEYDWGYHNLRTLEYIGMLVENHNQRDMSKEQCLEIAKLMEEMYTIWESDTERFSEMLDPAEIELNIMRANFEAGILPEEEYAKKLLEMYDKRNKEEFEIRDTFLNLTVPLEYIFLLDPRRISEAQSKQLADIYHNTISFLQLSQDTGSLSFQLEYAFAILEGFIEIPGVVTFEEMCISCLAALHPPTYVHTMMVGRITRCLCKHLLNDMPELFDDMREKMGFSDDDILDFAWHAAICHDFGKLSIIDTIMIYGRRILDEEFALIKQHPDMGDHLMSRFTSTRKYTNVARGHHKWYDDNRGYPENFSTKDLPERVIINLVTCADCLDAATDTVGRSYNAGKTMDDFTRELEEGSGTRYAPYLVELFKRPEVMEDIGFLLKEGRNENYLETYILLNGVREKKMMEEGEHE
ncbi:MAG: hypothetical protein K6C95_03170 [Lachnospiraceae bacterium]|nr:hypothetical protein [Lachnospiraceae bacterium]